MAAFDLALAHVRQGDDEFLPPEQINQLARRQEIAFRNTTLTPGNTLRLFVQQVLDAETYPAEELVELRLTRWMIEEAPAAKHRGWRPHQLPPPQDHPGDGRTQMQDRRRHSEGKMDIPDSI